MDCSSPPTPLARSLAIIGALDPVRLAQVFLELASVVRSQFWDGRRTGPDFISPMASLTKRQSGHLAKLVLQQCKNLQKIDFDHTDGSDVDADISTVDNSSQGVESVTATESHTTHSQAVAVLDFGEVSLRYTILADVDLMVLVPILLSLFVILQTNEWSPACVFIAIDFIGALILGPGTLTLVRRTSVHPTELNLGPGCAVLMDDDFTVVIRGSQGIIEAVTEGGFYLSFAKTGTIPMIERWEEKQVISDLLFGTLEGGCRGVCEAIAMRFLHLHTAIPYLKETAYVAVLGRIAVKAGWWGLMASTRDSLSSATDTTPVRSVTRLTGELLGLLIVAACIASTSSATILLHAVLLIVQTSYFALFARLVLQSQNYRIRTERFLHALGRPLIRKWGFRTRAAAATFVCLVLCRDAPRPVGDINILGVLDTLIPDQRDAWKVWKERVADRITYEEHITFAPTIPRFRDKDQKLLKRRLNQAQSAHNRYWSYIETSSA